jgi:hypothetical protein
MANLRFGVFPEWGLEEGMLDFIVLGRHLVGMRNFGL